MYVGPSLPCPQAVWTSPLLCNVLYNPLRVYTVHPLCTDHCWQIQVLYAVFASVMLCLGAPFWHNHPVLIKRQDYKVV